MLTTEKARELLKISPNEEVFVRVEINPKFAVSNYGVVVNTWNNRLKKTHAKRSTGDVVVNLDGMTYRVSRLVATAFIENPTNSRFVLHKDENKSNNNYLNLCWSSSVKRKNKQG